MAETNPSAQVQPGAEAQAIEVSEFSSLLQREFKPKSDQAKEAVESAVRTLAEQALEHTALISRDVLKSIESMIAASLRDSGTSWPPGSPIPAKASPSCNRQTMISLAEWLSTL